MTRVVSGGAMPSIGAAISAARSGGRRMTFPVAPASYIYSHFKHVSGTPAPDGSRGVAVSKLKILDSLIDRLGQMKKRGGDLALGAPMTDERLDALIEHYKTQARQAQAASLVMPYAPPPPAQTGLVVNLVA